MIMINKEWIYEYSKLNCNIEDVLPKVFQNINYLAKNRRFEILSIMKKDNFIEMNVCTGDFEKYVTEDIDITDVVNFALKMYLPICRRNLIKETFKQQLDEYYLFKMLQKMGIETEEWEVNEEKDRIYAYIECPCCGTQRFYFSIDGIKKNVYVGCYNKGCKFHNKNSIDLISFIQQQYRKKYEEAIEYLAELCSIKFDNKQSDIIFDNSVISAYKA